MNFAFYVSGKASRLRRLLDQDRVGILADTKLVISDSEANQDLAARLDGLGIRFVCGDYPSTGSGTERSLSFSNAMLEEFRRSRIDYCFCFGVHILRGELLEAYRERIINFHPSVLPSFPGLNAIDKAVAAGTLILGNTAHFLSEAVDGGPMIMQSVMSAEEFRAQGYEAVLGLQNTMLDQIVMWLRTGRVSVREGRVTVSGAAVGSTVFYPPLE